MEPLNYHEVDEKFSEIDQWLCQMGLNQHNRIRIHQRNFTELAHAQDSGTFDLESATGRSGAYPDRTSTC
jgi:hypothetical protein